MNKLTPSENRILGLLTTRMGNSAICAKLGIKPTTLRVHFTNIRKKTGGLRESKSQHRGLTPAQLRVLRLRAEGRSFAQIGLELDISPQTAHNTACAGRRRLGIVATGLAGLRELRSLLPQSEPGLIVTMDDPMFR